MSYGDSTGYYKSNTREYPTSHTLLTWASSFRIIDITQMNKIVVIILSVVLGLGFVGFIIFAKESKKKTTPEGTDQIFTLSDKGMTKGDANAPLTLVEFADFQCPFCGEVDPVLDAVLADYDGKVKFVFKHFPLLSIHKNALPAAIAAEAAGMQDKFWEMKSILFERQQEWSSLPSADKKFEEYAKEIGLDVEKFKVDMKNDELSKKIDEQRGEGISVGVTSTPTFFVNGKKVELQSLSVNAFKDIFDAELAKVQPNEKSETSTPSATAEPAQ